MTQSIVVVPLQGVDGQDGQAGQDGQDGLNGLNGVEVTKLLEGQTSLLEAVNNIQDTLTGAKLNIVSTWPPNFPGLGTSVERFVEQLDKLSNFEIKYHAAGTYSPNPMDAFSFVKEGKYDAFHSADYYLAGMDPAYYCFSGIPGGFNNTENISWILYGGGQALWDEVTAKHGYKPLLCGVTGHQTGYWSKVLLDDFEGKNIRQPGLGAKVIEKMGAVAHSISGGELQKALEDGTIDATEWVGLWNDTAMDLGKHTKYFYTSNPNEPGQNLTLTFNLDVWNSLTPEVQSQIENYCMAETLRSLAEYYHQDSLYLDKIKENFPLIEVMQFSQDTQNALFIAAYETLDELVLEYPEIAKIYESQKKYINQSMDLSNITHKAFIDRNKMFQQHYGVN